MPTSVVVDQPKLSWDICRASEARELLRSGAARAWLSPAEALHFERLAVEKRRRDWLCGRIAAKRALMTRDPRLSPSDIEVFNAPEGRPFARLAGGGAPEISIAHGAAGGICAVSGDASPVGADLETIKAHGPAVLSVFMHPSEADTAGAEPGLWQTKLWTAKEAVLKLLGVGFACDPRDVRWFERERFLELDGAARRRWRALGSPRITVEHLRFEDALIAFAHCGGR